MELSVNEQRNIELRKVFNSITLITEAFEKLTICMRDSGFELTYQGKTYSAQQGQLTETCQQNISESIVLEDSETPVILCTDRLDHDSCKIHGCTQH